MFTACLHIQSAIRAVYVCKAMPVNRLISRRLAQYRNIKFSITLVIPTQINLCLECELKRNLTNKNYD